MSEDGTVVAFGSPRNNSTSHVSVYRLEGNSWEPFGTRILGQNNAGLSYEEGGRELLGWSVSLSSNGTVVAVGAPLFKGDERIGQVRVYRYSDGLWERFGQAIDDGAMYEDSEFGRSVSLSGDGLSLVVGAPEYDSPFDHIGQAQYFRYQGTSWNRVGRELFGEERLERFGSSVAVSRDGRTGTRDFSEFNNDFGNVRVFRLFNNDWSQVGQDLDGKLIGDAFGTSVGLSSDGNTVVVGSPRNGTGYAQVYRFDGGIWYQTGDDLQGEYEDDAFGTSVSLSSNAETVAVGAPINQEGRDTPGGHVRIFRWQ